MTHREPPPLVLTAKDGKRTVGYVRDMGALSYRELRAWLEGVWQKHAEGYET